jgi:cell division protein YceG involved in septum cleavage
MRRSVLLLVATILGTLVAAGCGTTDPTPVTVTIRRGSNFREAADSLAAHNLIGSPRLFSFYAARV